MAAAEPVLLESRKLPGKVTAGPAAGVNPKDYDLVGLCMQEPQYRSPGVRELLDAVGKSRVPCMSIMNMPPLPYIKRIPGLDYKALEAAYTDPRVWDIVDPKKITLNSPDPQAIRPPDGKANELLVTLPTNFKCARFDSDKDTAILRQLEKDVDAARFDAPEGKIELPVKLRVYDSIFVPLAKWAMLCAGNYRCITKDGMRTAQEAVHTNLEESRSVYNFVNDLCVKLGANRRTIWCRSRNMPPPRKACRARPRPRARSKRRAEYRARRQAGAADRPAKGPEPPDARCDGGAGRRAARRQSQKGGGLIGRTGIMRDCYLAPAGDSAGARFSCRCLARQTRSYSQPAGLAGRRADSIAVESADLEPQNCDFAATVRCFLSIRRLESPKKAAIANVFVLLLKAAAEM